MNRFNDFKTLYDFYNVQIRFKDRCYGGRPKNKELLRTWIVATTGYNDAKTDELVAQAQDMTPALDLDKEFEKSWTGFATDGDGVFLESRAVHAMIKQCASLLRLTIDKRGSKQILAEGTVVHAMDGGNKIRFVRNASRVLVPDGYQEDAIHVTTPQGERTALRRQDYIHQAGLEFQVWIMKTAPSEKRHLTEEDLVRILTLGQNVGLGASRSQSNGQFEVIGFGRA